MKTLKQKFMPHGAYLLLSLGVVLTVSSYLQPAAPEPAPLVPGPETLAVSLTETVDIPDFHAIRDIDEKKESFFSFLRPYIEAENALILSQRARLQTLRSKVDRQQPLSEEELVFIEDLSMDYGLEADDVLDMAHLDRLLKRVDIIPASLVLTQAANESAWGTSRFALEGNNFFGQWCYTRGCGLVPNRRPANANHEVRAFDSVAESVNAYFKNLNTFHVYQDLRNIRLDLRRQNLPVDGISLSEGLLSYSERGEAYVAELQAMIYSNQLNRYAVLD